MSIDYTGLSILVTSITSAGISIATFVRAGRVASRINLLEINTNSIKDALVKTTAEKEFARGGQVERDKHKAERERAAITDDRQA